MNLYGTWNIYKMGPALLGLPFIFLLFLRKHYSFISWGFLSCAFIYVFPYFANIGLGERYIFFMMFFLHLSLAWYFSTLGLLSFSKMKNILANPIEKNVHVFFFTLILGASILYQAAKLGFEQAGYRVSFNPIPSFQKYENPLDDYNLLKGKIKEGDIVMSDPLTAWMLPALTGAKIIALYHENPFVPDNNLRVNDSITFYSLSIPLKVRKIILQKYHATHVLLNFERMKDNEINRIENYYQHFQINPGLVEDLRKMGEITFKNDNLILFKLRNTAEEDT